MARFAFVLLLAACRAGPDGAPPVATFSIVAYDPATGDLGVAVQSRFFGVGSVVPWAEAGVGAVATQAWANVKYGPAALRLMREGMSAPRVVGALAAADEQRDRRQLGVVDAKGEAAAFTGQECMAWAGHREGEHYCAQGNILASGKVVAAMGAAFEKAEGPLSDRLMRALKAGQDAGGDRRGKQSAALLVVRAGAGYGGGNDRFVDLRVEDHPHPIRELERLLLLHKRVFARAHALR